MSGLLARWRVAPGVALTVAGVATGVVFAAAPAQAAPAKNLIGNSSAESVSRQGPTGWAKAVSGANASLLTTVSGGAQNGRKFLRAKITKFRTGAAWWYTPAAVVSGRSSYTYTEYYRSGSRTSVNAYFTVGSRVVGTRVAVLPASSRWKAARYTVTAPQGATRVRFGHLLASTGYVDVDNVSLLLTANSAGSVPSTPTPASPAPIQAPRTTSPVTPTSTKGLVSLTFDDGWANQATNAAPIMKTAAMPGTFYLISGQVGVGEYMNATQAKSLQASGSEIGSHTVSHQNLNNLDPATLASELANSKSSLEATFGSITSIAYPFGAGNPQVQAAAAKYYTNARSTNAGLNAQGKYNKYSLTIGYVLSTTSLSTVQGWVNEAKANGTWLILCYHRVANDQPSDLYTTSVSNFQSQISSVKASGVPVVTVRDGIRLTS